MQNPVIVLGIRYSWAEDEQEMLAKSKADYILHWAGHPLWPWFTVAFWLALLKTLPFWERWLCASSVLAARAASGSADAVTEPAPSVPFPFPEISWHCWSLVDQDPVTNSLQCMVSPLIPVLFFPYEQFQWFIWLSRNSLLSSLPCCTQQCLVFWPKAMGLLSSFPPNFWVPVQSAVLVLAWSFPNIASADYAAYLSHWMLLK